MNSRQLSIVPSRATRFCRRSGFSLVEVTLSIGIIAFAFVTIFTLVPVGMTTFRKTIDLSVGSQIAQKVMSDAIQTDFDVLIDNENLNRVEGEVTPPYMTFRAPKVGNPGWRYFDDNGSELDPSDAPKAIYHVLTRITPEAPLPTDGSTDLVRTLAQVTVQVVTNPGNRPIPIAPGSPSDQSKPLRNLVDPSKEFPVYTCAAMIAKNK